MKLLIICVFTALISPICLLAQLADLKHIENIEDFIVDGNKITSYSPDGKYYSLEHRSKEGTTTSIYRTNHVILGQFNRSFDVLRFDKNDRFFIAKQNDSLVKYDLPGFEQKIIAVGVDNFDTLNYPSRTAIICKTKENRLIVDLINQTKVGSIDYVTSYKVLSNTSVLLFRYFQDSRSTLEIYNIETKRSEIVWAGSRAALLRVVESPNKGSFAFVIEIQSTNFQTQKLLFYNHEKNSTVELGIETDSLAKSVGDLSFVDNGSSIYYSLRASQVNLLPNKGADVNIWHYKDTRLQQAQISEAKEELKELGSFIYHIGSNATKKVDQQNFKFRWFNCNMMMSDRAILSDEVSLTSFEKTNSTWFDEYLKPRLLKIWNVRTGQIDVINTHTPLIELFGFTPDGKFILWFDYIKRQLISYNTIKRSTTNSNLEISKSLTSEDAISNGRFKIWGLVGWLPSEKSILIYDEFDILQFSYEGRFIRNVTGGFGRENGISLKVASTPNYLGPFSMKFSINDEILVAGLQRKTQMGGYWKLKLSGPNKFELKNLRPYSIESRSQFLGIEWDTSSSITCLPNDQGYFVGCSTASTENIFYTHDLQNYKSVAIVDPGKTYNWVTAELITWEMLDGKMSQGILYRPKNFNPLKKYPVIFNYYEKRSREFHKFLHPGYSEHNINIPSFINQGYLVFVPDIYHSSGKNGDGTFNALESAAIHLSKLAYVDSTRIGLQGHSFGGWQTNFMITHSRRFAAACEASGVSDIISGYGQTGWDNTRHKFYELNSQGSSYGFGVTPWNNSDVYIRNSPIFKIDKITTPLLMMHGDQDNLVPFAQAIELFTGMQRAGKKVWLLHYHGAGHQLSGDNAIDYHTRMMQFFDHYLKDKPAPIWMTNGVSAIERQYTDGLGIDSSGRTP